MLHVHLKKKMCVLRFWGRMFCLYLLSLPVWICHLKLLFPYFFCWDGLYLDVSGELKSSVFTVLLLTSPLMSANICFTYLDALILKGWDLVDRVPKELWTEFCNIVWEAVTKTILKKKKCKKAKWLSEEALQIAEERKEAKGKGGRTPRVVDGQGGLACCDSWGCKESDMTKQLNWTELRIS